MAKKVQKNDPRRKAQRRLAKAQQELALAQAEHVLARQKADKLVARAAKRVETRAKAAAEAELQVLSLVGEGAGSTVEVAEMTLDLTPGGPVDLTQEAPFDLALGPEFDEPGSLDLAPDEAVVAASTVTERNTLRERERAALSALQKLDAEEGVSAADWRRASGQTETTLLRARDELAERGLIAREGPPGRGALYRVTEAGRSAS